MCPVYDHFSIFPRFEFFWRFLPMRLGLWIWRTNTREAKSLITSCEGLPAINTASVVMWPWPPGESGICRESPLQSHHFPFPILWLWSQSLNPVHLQGQGDSATPLRGKSFHIYVWNSSVRKICHLSLVLRNPFKPQLLICEVRVVAGLSQEGCRKVYTYVWKALSTSKG